MYDKGEKRTEGRRERQMDKILGMSGRGYKSFVSVAAKLNKLNIGTHRNPTESTPITASIVHKTVSDW